MSDPYCLCQCLYQLCVLLGTLSVTKFMFTTLRRFMVWEMDLHKRYSGGWAVVTGGTDGIGLGFCEELAKRKFNICIVSRNPEKLQKCAESLEKQFPEIQTKTITADFSKSHKEGFFAPLFDQLNGLDVSILVNNVGAMIDIGEFSSNPPAEISRELSLNLFPMAILTHHLLPKMLARPSKSAVITLSSTAVYANLKGSANYCSTKHYNDYFSRALQYEYGHKVDFLSVRPALVTTPLTRNSKSFLHVNKNQCAEGSLRSLGRVGVTSGHWWHELQGVEMELISENVLDLILGKIHMKQAKVYKKLDEEMQKQSK